MSVAYGHDGGNEIGQIESHLVSHQTWAHKRAELGWHSDGEGS